MSREKANRLLELASEQVEQGIYALKYRDYIELRNDKLTPTQIKRQKREYRRKGIRVYANT